MPPFEALKMARERSLDLVEISPNAIPPVCRIQDYGKFLYEKDKSERAARKKQKVITIKEVKFSVTVDDYQTKKNMAIRFLGDGDKVKASLRFKGRQMAHRDLGYKIVNRLILDIGDAGMVEFMPRMEGTTLHAIIAPTKKAEAPPKKPAAEAAPKPTEAAPSAPPASDAPPAQP
jgi:translation initiation factor IF-3